MVRYLHTPGKLPSSISSSRTQGGICAELPDSIDGPVECEQRGGCRTGSTSKIPGLTIQDSVSSIPVQEGTRDRRVWAPDQDRGFSVRRAYDWWSRAFPLVSAVQGKVKVLRKLRISHKVKVFMWLALQERLLTKARRARWHPEELDTCVLCNEEHETPVHLLCTCRFSRSLWERHTSEVGLNSSFTTMEGMWDAGQ
ncbi:hypothetical protein QJS10_CPB20g00744 [Acorus calamus]|uniref:Reverse transcriptase zinc-binding domain-containing protein n=1 Tax=Acorus calamus TaxID=4465 RepID=A0AAV9CC47_ACOCL|nr:hypothetical protein QJS10_CPB20g00744 [Acorus calamus]